MVAPPASPTASRRAFLQGSAGLSFALSLPAALLGKPATGADASGMIGAWVEIKPDGRVVLAVPVAEMGQGSLTGLAMVFAEEMDADWASVSTVYPPVTPEVYGNPIFGGVMATFGSGAIRGYWDKVRLQAAAVRLVLRQAAADRWRAPLSEVETQAGRLLHIPSGRSMTYGEVARFATAPDVLPSVDKSMLKKSADYRIIGKSIARLDVPAKTDGSAQFGIDVQVPEMVYATVLRSPVEGGAPQTVDDTAALASPGVLKVIRLDHSVGAIAETIEAAFAGRTALKVEWSSAQASAHDSQRDLEAFLGRAAKTDDPGAPYFTRGDADAAFAKAARVVKAQYSSDYAYHAQLEPMNLVAAVGPTGDTAEIWVGTQSVGTTAQTAAALLETTPDRIKVNQLYMGGGFGRRSLADLLPEVLPMAKAMGRPVKLIWSREQDVQSAKMRPMTGHQLEAALDANGEVIAWRHRIAAESIMAYTRSEQALETARGLDNLVLEGARHEYGIPNQAVAYLREKRGVAVASLRGVGAGHNKFAIETFIDELAALKDVDPVEFRLKLLEGEPRAQAVIRAVAEKAGWNQPRAPGRALGFAYAKNVETYVAAIGEISLDAERGEIRAHRFWLALDAGVVVNPDSVLAQTEGNVAFGLSLALKERVSVSAGRIQQSNFHNYPVLRISEMPEVDVQILRSDQPAKGIGEAALPMVAPCIGNALYALTGQRIRALPFTRERLANAS